MSYLVFDRHSASWFSGGWYGGRPNVLPVGMNRRVEPAYTPAKLVRIEDGLSNTIMLCEQANPGGDEPTFDVWAATESWVASALHFASFHPRLNYRNNSNAGPLFGYHPKVLVMSRFDGSVLSVSKDTAPDAVISMVGRANGPAQAPP